MHCCNPETETEEQYLFSFHMKIATENFHYSVKSEFTLLPNKSHNE